MGSTSTTGKPAFTELGGKPVGRAEQVLGMFRSAQDAGDTDPLGQPPLQLRFP
ncbi:hypothetical protein QFZ35_001640 [Arthrobacter ulcerisalmonis]|nr:hypothetical protein [Arthrobacter ulcerisalmonis]MDQ0663142.1 hypothetical protein [Arthrobacter ulcerisalmonis]